MDVSMTTDDKGQIAFLKVQIEAMRKGAVVLLPTMPRRYDLVLQWQGQFYRCQVKYAASRSPRSAGALCVDLRRHKKVYTRDEIDAVLVYIPAIDRICWFPPEVFHQKLGLHLRLVPAKNNQRKGCLMVADYIW